MKSENEKQNLLNTPTQYAGLGKRFKAFLYDYIIISAYILLIVGVGVGVRSIVGPLDSISPIFKSPIVLDGMAFVILILPVTLYFALQESSPKQGTWGKRKVGLRVSTENGDTLSRRHAFVRALIKFLPWQIAHTSIYHIEGLPFEPVEPSSIVIAGFVLVYVLAGVYIASLLISKKNRTPYDWISGAYVFLVPEKK